MAVAGVIINDRKVLRSFSSAIKHTCAKHVSNTNEVLKRKPLAPGKLEPASRKINARIIGYIKQL